MSTYVPVPLPAYAIPVVLWRPVAVIAIQEAFSRWDGTAQMLVDRLTTLLGQSNVVRDQLVSTREGARQLPSHSATRAAIFAGTKVHEARLSKAAAAATAAVERLQAASFLPRQAMLARRASTPTLPPPDDIL